MRSTTSARWLASKPRSSNGSRNESRRMRFAPSRSSHCCPRMSGRSSSSCRRSLPVWSLSSSVGKSSNTPDKSTAFLQSSAERCLVSREIYCRVSPRDLSGCDEFTNGLLLWLLHSEAFGGWGFRGVDELPQVSVMASDTKKKKINMICSHRLSFLVVPVLHYFDL